MRASKTYPLSKAVDACENPQSCLFCFDRCISVQEVPNDLEKLFGNCKKYLHPVVLPISFLEKERFKFCEKCLKSAVALTDLIEKSDFCEKDVFDLSFAFSSDILDRRRDFSVDEDTRKPKESDDVALPDFENESDSSATSPMENSDAYSQMDDPSVTSHTEKIQNSPIVVSIELGNIQNVPKSPSIHEIKDEHLLEVIISKDIKNAETPRLNLISPGVTISNERSTKGMTLSNKKIQMSNQHIVKPTRQDSNEKQQTSGFQGEKGSESSYVLELHEDAMGSWDREIQGTSTSCIVTTQPKSSVSFHKSPSISMENNSTMDTKNETVFDGSGKDQGSTRKKEKLEEMERRRLSYLERERYPTQRRTTCLNACYYCLICCLGVLCFAVVVAVAPNAMTAACSSCSSECPRCNCNCCKCCCPC